MKKIILLTLLISIPTLAQKGSKKDDSVDREIKKTHIQMEVQRQRLDRDLKSEDEQNLDMQPEVDFTSLMPSDVSPVEWGEQQDQLKTESLISDTRSNDPVQRAEQAVYRRQEQERARTIYRRSIQRQFDENLEAAGIKTRRNIAEEILRLELIDKNTSK